jgi:hypothetical protein
MDPWLAMMAWIHAVNPPLDGFISIGFGKHDNEQKTICLYNNNIYIHIYKLIIMCTYQDGLRTDICIINSR